MLHIGFAEILLICLVVFLLFGPEGLINAAKKAGEFMVTLKKAMEEHMDPDASAKDEKKP